MAFGFIKKVFSFGRKDEPVRVEDTSPTVPAADAGAVPEFLKRDDVPPGPLLADSAPEPTSSEPEVPAGTGFDVAPVENASSALSAASGPATAEHPQPPGPFELTPPDDAGIERSSPDGRRATDHPVEPSAAEEPELFRPPPSAEILPPIRQPGAVEAKPVAVETAPEPPPFAPPVEPPDADTEIQAAVSEGTPPAVVAPVVSPEEIAAPIRQPDAVPIRPVEAGSAPEPQAVPQPAPASAAAPDPTPRAGGPTSGKVTVTRSVAEKVAEAPVAQVAQKTGWFQRLRDGLSRSSRELTGSITGIFTKRKLDDATLEELEEVLIRADLGMETAIRVTDALSSSRYGRDVSDAEVRAIMAREIEKVLAPVAMPLELDLSHKPHVILVVGVNGTGKTTTIGKLAAKLTAGGLSVTLAAGDTFRAAAIEQLKIWGERTGSPVVSSKLGADAAGLAWDAYEKAREAGSDVLIIDTAGRLQNKTELMAELEKIVRVLGKQDAEAPHTVLQTVDATTGQNAVNQVEIFRNVAGVNGLVMTKLDGTARGGILVAIAARHNLPVYFIGVGEQVDDLEPFSAGDFARAIAGVA